MENDSRRQKPVRGKRGWDVHLIFGLVHFDRKGPPYSYNLHGEGRGKTILLSLGSVGMHH